MSPPQQALDRPLRRADPTVRAVAVVAVASGLLTVILARQGWFYYDDFWNLTVAHDLGWGWDLLGRPVFGHVIPGSNVLIGVVAGRGSGAYGWAVAMAAAFGALIPVAAAWAARRVGAGGRRSVVAAVLVASAAPIATMSTWWSAGTNLYPSMLAGTVVLGAAESSRRGARWGWPAAAGALAFGMLFSEGAVVFLVAPFVLWMFDLRGPLTKRALVIWGHRRSWRVLIVPFVCAAIIRASASGPVQAEAHPPLVDVLLFPMVFLLRGFVPALLGPVTGRVDLLGSPAITTVVGLVVVGAALVIAWRGIGREIAAPVTAVVATVLARGVMVAWGRLLLLGWEVSLEGRYYADLVWLVPVLVIGRWPANRSARRSRADQLVKVAVAAVVVLGLIGQVAIARHAPFVESGRYRDRLARSWSEAPPGASVLDSLVPATVLGPQFGPFTFLSRTAGLGVRSIRFEPTDDLLAPDASGRLHPVRLGPLTDLVVSDAFTAADAPGVTHVAGCWQAGATGALVWVPLTRPISAGAWVLDLRIGRRSDPSVRFLAAGTAPSVYLATSAVGRSPHRWLVAATPFQASQIGFELGPNARLCLSGGSLSMPVASP